MDNSEHTNDPTAGVQPAGDPAAGVIHDSTAAHPEPEEQQGPRQSSNQASDLVPVSGVTVHFADGTDRTVHFADLEQP